MPPATLVNVVCSVVPTVVTVAMIANAIRLAMSPYSMAVAPDWLPRQRKANLRMYALQIDKRVYKAPATLVKVVCNVVPTDVTAAMMATAIKAAMRPYSIAVAPD